MRSFEAEAILQYINEIEATDDNPGGKGEGAVTGESYRALKALVEKKDPTLQHCGLVKVVANDGTIEWVRRGESVARFKVDGKNALFGSSARVE